jgi:hypothetical protein
MHVQTTNLWKVFGDLAVWGMVFLILLLGGFTFNGVDNLLSRTLGIGLIFFATLFTVLIWSARGNLAASGNYARVVGWTACFILAIASVMAGWLIFSENSFHTWLGIWTNQGIVLISLLVVPAIALGFFTRNTAPGRFAFLAGSALALVWFLWAGLVLLAFIWEASRAANP